MRDAVAAMLVSGDELFIVRRQSYLRAFPGYHAFPGGKIDPEDDKDKVDHPLVAGFPCRQISALHRELIEELDFDLAAALDQGLVSSLTHFGEAITPAIDTVRFRVSHYKIVLTQKPRFTLDSNELAAAWWQTAAAWKEQYQAGKTLMVEPMRRAIFALADDVAATSVQPFNVQKRGGELFCIQLIDGLKIISVPSNTLPPAIATNALWLGDEGARTVLVDPSPKSAEVFDALNRTLDRGRVDAILLSHHHPDHHERAMDLARLRDIPVLCTQVTLRRLNARYGTKYTDGVAIELIKEGDEITYWKGQAVRAYELPGHDDGMVGLAPDNLAWMFVADLAQTHGSIFIPEDEGDLSIYMASLRRVIELDPAVIVPSHGIPSGTTGLIKHAFDHRIKRGRQIMALRETGADDADILAGVYPGLAERLKPLALQNIHQHLRAVTLPDL